MRLLTIIAVLVLLVPAPPLAAADNPIISFFESIVDFFADNLKKTANSVVNMFSLNCVVAFDISGSMLSYFENVKQNTQEFIGLFSPRDNLVFATFHEEVNVLHNGPATPMAMRRLSRDIAASTASGQWTDIDYAVGVTQNLLTELERAHPGRLPILVFVSDGLDDPNPARTQRDKRDLGSYARSMAFAKGWQIYDIGDKNFGHGLTNEAARRKAIEGLNVNASIERRIIVSYGINILLLVLLLLLLILLFRRLRSRWPRAARAGFLGVILALPFFLHHVLGALQWIAAIIVSVV